MATLKRCFLTGVFLLLALPLSLQAQAVNQLIADEKAPAYQAEREFIESTLQTLVAILQEATMRNEESGLGARLRDITGSLSNAARLMTPTPNNNALATKSDLDDLRRMLQNIANQLETIQDELEDQESYDLADQVRDVQRDIRRAVREVDRIEEEAEQGQAVSPQDGDRWLRPGRYGNQTTSREDRQTDLEREVEDIQDEIDDAIDEATDGRYRARDWRREREKYKKRGHRDDWRRYAGTFVGGYSFRWPYRRETALYRTAPSIRYNRVEGFVLGVGKRPLEWNSYSRATVYGQIGYAFELDEWRSTIGVETRLDNRRNYDYGTKIGVSYRYNTDTRDSWKTSWLENSLAAFFFENDFFDYYQVEGWSFYAVQRLTPYLQVSAGYRDEDYTTLNKTTGWSFFKGDGFTENPAIDDGEMRSFVFAAEGGRVVGLHSLPSGAAFRLEAEIGEGLGGAFEFSRFVADGRVYVPLTNFSSLGLRLRGGVTSGDIIPIQKEFSIGGIGSVRGYTQNSILGSKMLLANAEYIIDDIDIFDDWFDDIQFIGFADFGWVNAFGTGDFDFDDVMPSAGFGIGLDDRDVRLELAFPLHDFGGGQDPSLWLRITPSF